MLPPQVPLLRSRLLARSGAEWDALAQCQTAEQFGAAAVALSQQRLERMLRSFELMCGMEEWESEARQREVRRCMGQWLLACCCCCCLSCVTLASATVRLPLPLLLLTAVGLANIRQAAAPL